MSNSVFQSFGGLDLPVGADDVASSLTSLDPARDRLLALFASAINSEFSAVWTETVTALGSSHALYGTSPVNDTLPHEPDKQVMESRKGSFPLLCLHRTGESQIEPWLMDEDRLTQEWHLHYILGAFELEGQRRLLDIGQAVAKLVAAVIRDYGHQSYESGANQIELADLNTLRIKSWAPGRASFSDEPNSPAYWSVLMTLESTEVSAPITSQIGDLEGFDISLDVGGANAPDINVDFVSATTDPEYQAG